MNNLSFEQIYIFASIALIGIGIYCLVARKNVIQMLIGLEIIAKGVTISFILGGFMQNNEQIAQAIVITIILIEVITAVIIMSLIVKVFHKTGGLDIKNLKRLKH